MELGGLKSRGRVRPKGGNASVCMRTCETFTVPNASAMRSSRRSSYFETASPLRLCQSWHVWSLGFASRRRTSHGVALRPLGARRTRPPPPRLTVGAGLHFGHGAAD